MNREQLNREYYGTVSDMSSKVFKEVRSNLSLSVVFGAIVGLIIFVAFVYFFLGALPALFGR